MQPLNWKVVTWSLGLFGAVTFLVCVVYGFLVPKAFHMVQLLELALPGFRWLSLGSFVLGFVESFLYGACGTSIKHTARSGRWSSPRPTRFPTSSRERRRSNSSATELFGWTGPAIRPAIPK